MPQNNAQWRHPRAAKQRTATTAAGAASSNIPTSDINPLILLLGELIGVLNSEGSNEFSLNDDWFSNPLTYLEDIPSNPKLLDLIEALMGSAEGTALGTPVSTMNKTWYPIQNPVETKDAADADPIGLYLVSSTPDTSEGTVLGFGLLYNFIPATGITITPYGYFPVIQLPKTSSDSISFVLGQEGHPVQLGINVDGKGVFQSGSGLNEISFDGINIGADIYFEAGKFPSLNLEFTNLKLPGETKGSNRSILDLIENTSIEEWITLALSVMVTQLSKTGTAGQAASNIINSILELLGLLGNTPELNWTNLTQNPSEALITWFRTIASSDANLQEWLNYWYCIFNNKDPFTTKATDTINGDGTLVSPFYINIADFKISNDLSIAINFTMASVVEKSGVVNIYPGFSVAASATEPVAGKDFGISVQADVAILDFSLSADGTSADISFFPSFDLMAIAASGTKGNPLFSTTIEGSNFSVGTLQAGFQYEQGDSNVPMPSFKITDVVSGQGSWPVIDMSNLDIQTVVEIVEPIIEAAIQEMFPSTSDNNYVANMAALLGLAAPPSFTGTWPLADKLLLSSDTIQILLNNPLVALGAYYERCLSTQDSNQKYLWEYLMPSMVELFGGDGTHLNGDGTASNPWEITMLSVAGASLYLQNWKSDDNPNALNLGLYFDVPVTIQGITVDLGLATALMQMTLPNADGTGSYDATWFQSATAQLKITGDGGDPLSISFAGLTFSLDDFLFEIGWNQINHFFTSAALENIIITAKGLSPINFGTIELTDLSWSQSQLTQFATGIVNVLGLLMMEQGGRIGVGLATLLGLVPGLADLFNGNQKQADYPFAIPVGSPDIFKLPSSWPEFELKNPSNPWIDVQTQISKLFAGGGATMEPAMQLIGWSIMGTLPTAPATIPVGDLNDPWYVGLPDVWDIEVLAWLGANNQTGYGIRRSFSKTAYQAVQMDASIRLDVPGFKVSNTLLGNVKSPAPVAPRVWITGSFANPTAGTPLVSESTTGLTIGSVNIGANAAIINGAFSYGLQFAFLESRVTNADPLETIELTQIPNLPQYTCEKGMQFIESLADALMNKLSASINQAAGQFPQLNAFLDILSLVEILKKTGTNNDEYGINLGAWNTILANPGAYFVSKTEAVLEDGTLVSEFFQDLATILGYSNFTLPASAQGVQYLGQALGLLKPYPKNTYGLVINQWVSLIKHPISFFQTSIPALFNDTAALKLLVSQIKGLTNPPSSIFSVDSSGNVITLQTPLDDPLKIGSEIILFADLQVNLKTLSMTLEVGAGLEIANTAIAFQFTPTFSGGDLSASYAFVLKSLPSSSLPEAFPPLDLYPFPTDTTDYLKQLGIQIPVSILSALTSNVLNNYVVPEHQTVLNIFEVLGLTRADETTKEVQIIPLAGIFMHPIDWMFSEAVLGDSTGHLDLTKLGQLLYALTGAAGVGSSIKLEPYDDGGNKDGAQITGLPYGTTLYLTSNNTTGATLQVGFNPPLQSPAPDINLTAGLSFGLSKGFDINGDIVVQVNLGPKGSETDSYVKVDAGYAKSAFHLDIEGQYNKTPFTTIKLVPFGGLSQFIPSSGDIQNLLQLVGDQLFKAFDSYAADHPSDDLVKFIQDIEQISGITSGQTLFDFFKNIKTAPLAAFSSANIKNTISGIYDLVNNVFKLEGFSIAGTADNLLEYTHSLPGDANNSISLFVGNQSFNGQNEVFGIWIQPSVKMEWFTLGLAQTGVGVTLDGTNLEYNVEIDLGMDLSSEPIAGLPSPVLALSFTGDGTSFGGLKTQVFPIAKSTDDGTLIIDILPTPALEIQGQGTVTVGQWLEKFAVKFLVPFVADLALSTTPVNTFLSTMKIGQTDITPGAVLTGWGLLDLTDKTYTLVDLDQFYQDNNSAEGIVTKLIFTALDLLKGKVIFSVAKPKVSISVAADETNNLYGLDIQIQDVVVSSGSGGKSPKLVFQLGKWYANQTKGDNWVNNTEEEPGLIIYFIQEVNNSSFKFYPKVELLSVGMDFDGPNEKTPLVDIKGFTLNAIQPRAYLSLDFNSGTPKIDFGTAIFMDGIGVPLGPGFGQTGGGNPVAQNLLSSGENSSGNTSATNPAFSFSTNYVSDAPSDKFKFLLYDDKGNPTEKVWIPIMRAFGPLNCRKVGFGWVSASKLLELLFDGSVSLAGLTVDLQDLEIGVPVTDPTNFNGYTLDLAGIDITFEGGPVTISGGFLKIGSGSNVQYVGSALLQALSFSLGAFGAYGLVNDHPSMFIFAYLDTPLGGPPFFFVKGLSGGFGYNRAVVLPENTADIATYPMIAGVSDPSALGGTDGNAPSGTQVLEKLGTEYFPPKQGQYWVAAGIKFSTFEIVDSNAVVILQFGQEFEIDLIGTSGIILPKKGLTYVNAELAFKVVFNPSVGIFLAEAVLTSNSYVIVPECKLTGGFAFYAWFKNQTSGPTKGASAGEFVVTLGGYYPGWTVPSYYPAMPRLGINWHFSDALNLNGGAYFAMTPSCVMAGASLSIVFRSGGLKAWLDAYANFLISWKPFYYQISIGVSVGASYSIFKVELGCSLELWGPQMAGVAKISWFIISFSIKFGDQSTPKGKTSTIDWIGQDGDGFVGYFLPPDQAPAAPPSDQTSPSTQLKTNGVADTPQKVQQVTKIIANNGLIKQNTNPDGTVDWNVRASDFAFELQSVAPLNQVTFDSTVPLDPITKDTPFGIKPIGCVKFAPGGTDKVSSMQVSFYYNDSLADANEFIWTNVESIGSVPESLWGTVNNGKESPSSAVIPNVLQGVNNVMPTIKEPVGGLPTLDMDNLGRTSIANRVLPLISRPQLTPANPVKVDDDSLSLIESTIMDSTVLAYRNEIIDSIVGLGVTVNFDGSLDQIAAFAETTFQAPPLVGELGSIGEVASSTTTPITLKLATPDTLEQTYCGTEESEEPIRIRAIIHQHAMHNPSDNRLFKTALQSDVGVGRSSGLVHRRICGGNGHLGRALLKAHVSETGMPQLDIHAGKSFLLDIPEGNSRHTFGVRNREVPIRIAVFDKHQQLIKDDIIAKGNFTCPKEASQVVLSAQVPRECGKFQARGWHQQSSLLLVNPNALLIDDVLVVPHNPIRIRNKKFNHGNGVVSGASLVAKSWKQVSQTTIVRADIKTIFPESVKTVALIISQEISEGRAPNISKSVRIRVPVYTNELKTDWDFKWLSPTDKIRKGDDAILIYELPTNRVLDNVAVVTGTNAGWYQKAVLGFEETAQSVCNNWKKVSFRNRHPNSLEETKKTTLISIKKK